jgi:polyribonucleotide 5'-hydroxyl-kinase
MDRLIRNMGENINEKLDVDPEGTPYCPLIIYTYFYILVLARASGLIVDTPSSYASGPASNDHRLNLIKACIDAFKSMA